LKSFKIKWKQKIKKFETLSLGPCILIRPSPVNATGGLHEFGNGYKILQKIEAGVYGL